MQQIFQRKVLAVADDSGVAFYAIFQYWPFYGLLAAFKDYQPRLGILGSPWADNYGFAEFIRILHHT